MVLVLTEVNLSLDTGADVDGDANWSMFLGCVRVTVRRCQGVSKDRSGYEVWVCRSGEI